MANKPPPPAYQAPPPPEVASSSSISRSRLFGSSRTAPPKRTATLPRSKSRVLSLARQFSSENVLKKRNFKHNRSKTSPTVFTAAGTTGHTFPNSRHPPKPAPVIDTRSRKAKGMFKLGATKKHSTDEDTPPDVPPPRRPVTDVHLFGVCIIHNYFSYDNPPGRPPPVLPARATSDTLKYEKTPPPVPDLKVNLSSGVFTPPAPNKGVHFDAVSPPTDSKHQRTASQSQSFSTGLKSKPGLIKMRSSSANDLSSLIYERQHTRSQSNAGMSLGRYTVTKEKGRFSGADTKRILEVTSYGSVLVMQTKYNDISFEVPDLSYFQSTGSNRVILHFSFNGVKTRNYKFQNRQERDHFMDWKDYDTFGNSKMASGAKYDRATWSASEYRNEKSLQIWPVVAHRVGSKVIHRGHIALTNYRIVIINQLDLDKGDNVADKPKLSEGTLYVPAVSVPWLLIESHECKNNKIYIHCKDLRTLEYSYDQNSGMNIQEMNQTIEFFTSTQSSFAFAFESFESMIIQKCKKDAPRPYGRSVREVVDFRDTFPWKDQYKSKRFSHTFAAEKAELDPPEMPKRKNARSNTRINSRYDEVTWRGLLLKAVGDKLVVSSDDNCQDRELKEKLNECRCTITDINGHSQLDFDNSSPQAFRDYIIDMSQSCEIQLSFEYVGVGDENYEAIRLRENDLNHRDNRIREEYMRLLGTSIENSNFRITNVNEEYKLCKSYPPLMLVPKNFQDTDLMRVADFRSSGRIPSVTWVSAKDSISIARSSQPNVGAFASRSETDEEYLNCLRKSNRENRNQYVIIDCRPALNAHANKLKGKGFENMANYENCHLDFYDIENIHKMRDSLKAVRNLVQGDPNDDWFGKLGDTKWLYHVRQVLACSLRVVSCIREDKVSCLIHCSDGWDRTAQVSALSQMMLDPYYRTFQGFLILLQKEWLWFGHMCALRNGLYGPEGTIVKKPKERSPVFLQFLDCCFQLISQFPSAFEFNELLLLFIAEHFQSGWFGNFYCGNERERDEMSLWLRTNDMWYYLKKQWFANERNNQFTNPLYINKYRTIRPSVLLRDMKFWTTYYCRYNTDDQDSHRDLLKQQSLFRIVNTSEMGGIKIVKYRTPKSHEQGKVSRLSILPQTRPDAFSNASEFDTSPQQVVVSFTTHFPK